MKIDKQKCLKFLYPPRYVKLSLTILSVFGLLFVFLFRKVQSESPLAISIYVLSFYTLCVLCLATPPLLRKGRTRVYENRHVARFLSESVLRARLSLFSGTVINLAYAVFKLCTGIYYRSVWFGAVAVYYMLLSIIRVFLLKSSSGQRSTQEKDIRILYGWKAYRTVGRLLLLLQIAMAGMVVQMIWQNRGYVYPGFVIYASATYTFYRITAVIIRIVKSRKTKSPVYAAANALDFSAACMAVFALQTAMFSSFGAPMNPSVCRIMNIFTGGTVCLIVAFTAISMLSKSHHAVRRLSAHSTHNQIKQEVFPYGKE